jgi:hypothetical protein
MFVFLYSIIPFNHLLQIQNFVETLNEIAACTALEKNSVRHTMI